MSDKSALKYINSQFKSWKDHKNKIEIHNPGRIRHSRKKNKLPFITISREYGCLGYFIGQKVAESLNSELEVEPPWAAYDKKILDYVMENTGLTSELFDTLTGKARKSMSDLMNFYFNKLPSQLAIYRQLAEVVKVLAENGNVILVGRASNYITRGIPHGFHVRIIASMDKKIQNITSLHKISPREAEKMIINKSLERDDFIRKYIRFDLEDPQNYDLILNNSLHSDEEAVRLIISGMRLLTTA
jgi:cytidylate kinase